jgi:hypothetical protein
VRRGKEEPIKQRDEIAMIAALNYEDLVQAFNEALVTKLRGHAAEAEYLEMWVPDEDPVKSLLNMVEAAQAYGRDGIAVQVAAETLSKDQINELSGILGDIGAVEITSQPSGWLIEVKDL